MHHNALHGVPMGHYLWGIAEEVPHTIARQNEFAKRSMSIRGFKQEFSPGVGNDPPAGGQLLTISMKTHPIRSTIA